MSSTRDIAESERTAPLQRATSDVFHPCGRVTCSRESPCTPVAQMTSRQRRWHFYDLVQKNTFEKGMIINYPSMNICQANDPNAVQTQFGAVCFKTRYAIVIENENELEVLQLGTAGGSGPLAKSTAIRADCFGLKKEGDDDYYCWDEDLKRNVAVTPGKGVYDIAKYCPYQPVTGSFGNILDSIRLPRDSRIQIHGTIDEQVLNSILQKRARRLLQKLTLTMPPEMWIEVVQKRLDNDKEALQMQKDRISNEQTKWRQHPKDQPRQHAKPGQAQSQALDERNTKAGSKRQAVRSDTTMKTYDTKRARTSTDVSMRTPASILHADFRGVTTTEWPNNMRGPPIQGPPSRIPVARRDKGPGSNGGSFTAPQGMPPPPPQRRWPLGRQLPGNRPRTTDNRVREPALPNQVPETRKRRDSYTNEHDNED